MLKNLMLGLAVFLLAGAAFAASTGHSVTLSWTAPADYVAGNGATITVMRATGACTGTPNFTVLATGILPAAAGTTTGTYVDNTVTVGQYCYTAYQVENGQNSSNSNSAAATVTPLPPTGVTVTASQ